jgi:hypothetical protein
MRILSIAPQYHLGRSDAGSSHWIPFQRSLAEAALGLSHEFTIIACRGADPSGVEAGVVLDTLPHWPEGKKLAFDWEPGQLALERTLKNQAGSDVANVVAIRYEGRLQEYPFFVRLAESNPRMRFIWNFFASPPGLAVEDDSAKLSGFALNLGNILRKRTPSAKRLRSDFPTAPKNLLVLADEWGKHALAHGMGIASRGVWPLTSSFDAVGRSKQRESLDSQRGKIERQTRVLILHSGWQFDDATRAEVLATLRDLRGARNAPSFSLAGAQGSEPNHLRWINRVRSLGVDVLDGAVDAEVFVERIVAHDAVWLPNGRMYREKSSGKVLDALSLGTVVLAPAGSFPAAQVHRWIPWGFDYASRQELVLKLNNLDRLLPAAQDALSAQLTRVQTDASPKSAVSKLVQLVETGTI